MAALQRPGQQCTGNYGASCNGADVAVLEKFPTGLRVLVVDDDHACLKIVEHMLRRCLYQGQFLLRVCLGEEEIVLLNYWGNFFFFLVMLDRLTWS